METSSLSDFQDKICIKQADINALATLIIKDEKVITAALENQNIYHILVGIHILADLTSADTGARFEKIFEQFYNVLFHKSMVVISHVCLASGRIMLHKPGLRRKIEDILLKIDQFIGQQKHKDLIKGAVLEAFTEARTITRRKQDIQEFARTLLNSAENPKSRKLAKSYLEDPDICCPDKYQCME